MAQRNFAVSKILSVSDVSDKVELPAAIRKHMQLMMNKEENSMELTASDRWGQEWTLKYCSYVRKTGGPKNVLSGAGWRQIVDDNGVRPGDKLIFSRDQVVGADGVLEYKIQVKRQTKTFFRMSAAVHDSCADGESFYEEEVIKPKSQPRMTFQGNAM
ncbi:hypothetical protein LWI29_008531 [Acer saccharum]|uniref:TF-B3 domain-containing protein n=1 Tax=Acer saccharum TaxID=4024 RepID=A0AA39T205_ACESA|nr:hypothetical protein LWI29_008531 [Acer saccharum]